MKDIYFLLFQKKLFPFPLDNKEGIIVDANIGKRKLNIPLPF